MLVLDQYMTKTFQLLWWCCFFTLVTSSIELSWFASLAFNPWARLWDVLMSGIWKNNCSYKRMLFTWTQLQIYNKEWKAPGNENEDDKTKFFRRGRGPGHCLNNTSALFSNSLWGDFDWMSTWSHLTLGAPLNQRHNKKTFCSSADNDNYDGDTAEPMAD